MTGKTDKKPVKRDVTVAAVNVIFDPADSGTHTHWGVSFALDDGLLLASMPTAQAEAMVECGRVVIRD